MERIVQLSSLYQLLPRFQQFSMFYCICFICVCACVHTQALWLCLTLCGPTYCSPPHFSVHGILQARIMEWVAVPFTRESSWPRCQTNISCISCIGRVFFTTGTPGKPKYLNVSMLMLMFSQILVLSHFTGRVNKSRNLSPIIFITQVNLDFYTDKNIN